MCTNVLHYIKITCNLLIFLQEAIAIGIETELARLGQEGSYFKELPAVLLNKRDSIIKVLKEAGLTSIVPEGGYFVLADTANLGKNE